MLLEHYNELTVLKWPPPLPDIRAPLACFGTEDAHHGYTAGKSGATARWLKFSEEFFSIKAVLKENSVPSPILARCTKPLAGENLSLL